MIYKLAYILTMAWFLEIPTEIRQQIIYGTFPSEFCPTVPCPAHMLGLLLACRQLHLDTSRVMEACWSPKVTIRDPDATATISRLKTRPKFKVRSLTLQVFALIGIDNLKSWVGGDPQMESWSRCVSHLPRRGVREVIVDLTLAPQWVLQKRPDWVNTLITDRRVGVLFLADQEHGIVTLLDRLDARYNRGHAGRHNPPLVTISMGGWMGWRSIPSMERMITTTQQNTEMRCKPQFTGTYIMESDVPTPHSLLKVSRDWGVRDASTFLAWTSVAIPVNRAEADFSALNPVSWSSQTKSAFYKMTLQDAPGTLGDLKMLLAFAFENQQRAPSPSDRYLDFHSAASERRRLIHDLCRDLKLKSESAGEGDERYVRVFGTLQRTGGATSR